MTWPAKQDTSPRARAMGSALGEPVRIAGGLASAVCVLIAFAPLSLLAAYLTDHNWDHAVNHPRTGTPQGQDRR